MRSAPNRTPSKLSPEQGLRDRISFNQPVTSQPETISTGIREVDTLSHGLPRGRITEVFGPDSSGRTSLLLSTLAEVTEKEEVCAIIDPAGVFDPESAAHMGVDLEQLLWIRTPKPDINQTLKAVDLLIQGGGFGLIGVDFGEFSHTEIRRVPHSSWFRLQRAVENTPTILLFIGREACTRTCASLVLGLSAGYTHWTPSLFYGSQPHVEILRFRVNPPADWNRTPHPFFIQPAHFQAIASNPTEVPPQKDKESNIEGVPCHEF